MSTPASGCRRRATSSNRSSRDGAVVYGVTTGFGDLATTFIEPAQAGRLQENLLMSHAAGVGAPFPREIVRAMLLLRANTLALGHSGCRPLLVDRLLAFLANGIHPVVPEQGSVGASGDLAPLAHLALPLIGRGEVEVGGTVMPAADRAPRGGPGAAGARGEGGPGAPQRHPDDGRDRRAAPRRRRPADAHRERRGGDVGRGPARDGCGVRRRVPVGAPASRPGRGRGGTASPASRQHAADRPSRLRPQGPGPVLAALRAAGPWRGPRRADHLRRVLDIELNSATDNPLVFPGGGVAAADTLATGGGRVISGGNFHGEPIALALDFAKLALAELGSISERRSALLVDARLNGGLPPFLAPSSGIDSGMMIYQYTAAALVSEHKVLAHPASVDSIPTSANQEDHVSMGSIAARHARAVLDGVERIVGIELLLAAQALDLRLELLPGASPGQGVATALTRIRERIDHLDADREPGPDLAAASALVHEGALADLAGGSPP